MKILLIHNAYQQFGGEDVAVEQQATLLRNKGYNVRICLFKNQNFSGLKDKIQTSLNAFYNRSSIKLVDREIQIFKPDIIHIHNIFFVASPSVLFVAKKYNIPVIVTLHNYRLLCSNALLLRDGKVCELCINEKLPTHGIKYKCYRSSALESALVTNITGIHKIMGTWKNKVHTYIALTEFAKNKFLNSSLNIGTEQIAVIPNFSDDPGFETIQRENFFLYVGRISNEKGISILLECFAQIPQHNLIVAGIGPDLEKHMENYGSYSNIKFVGMQQKNQVLQLMKRCQALVFPSIWYEGLPFTIIESFSVGTPVIASNIGSMSELITHGYNGLHFKVNDVQDLKDSILNFPIIDSEKTKMSRQARETFERLYSQESYFNSIINIYKKAIESKK